MPAAKTTRRQTVGKAFKATDESKPVGQKWRESGRDKLPSVVLMDRASLALLRPIAEEFGWPRHQQIGTALERAQRAGKVSLAPWLERFGLAEMTGTSFIVLPVLDGYEEKDAHRTFRAAEHDGVVVLYPPGADVTSPPPKASPPVTLKILFFPFAGRQEDALAAAEYEVLFGGAKGGAKTAYLVAAAARQIDRPAYKALVFRKTFKSLEEVKARSHAMYVPMGAVWNENDSQYTFPSGAIIELGYCEKEADTDRYQGREFGFVGGDEFAQVADRKVRDRLISETRCPDPEVVRMIRWTANPIGPGVALLKRLFIGPCGQDGATIHREEYDIEGIGKVVLARRFIPSRVTDNPVYRDDPVYMATLHSLPDRMKRLLLHGDWSAALGAALDELSWAKHWIGPDHPHYLKAGVPDHWPLMGFLDWGFSHRWCFVAVAIDEQGKAWVVDTLWGSREYVDDIAARIWRWVDTGRVPRPIWASKLCFAKRSQEGQNVPTYAEQFAKARLPMLEANEDPGTRITGLNNLRQWLAWQHSGPDGGEGEPRLVFLATPGNRILFQQLEQMVPNPDDTEDVLKVDYDPDADQDGVNISGDDGYDALKMFATIRPLAAKKPKQEERRDASYDSGLDDFMVNQQRARRRRGSGRRGF
jgi:hypothetical protein